MEVSRGTNARVSSDFSIDSILRRDSVEEPVPTNVSVSLDGQPPWLFCSRYRPPRIPRVSSAACRGRSRRAGRHARVPFTATQSTALEAAFDQAPYLAPPALRALAHALQLREDRIKIWFQNRRARERREKSIPAPQAVSIPPTHERFHHLRVRTFEDIVSEAHSMTTSGVRSLDKAPETSCDEHYSEDGRDSPVDVVTVEDCSERMPQR